MRRDPETRGREIGEAVRRFYEDHPFPDFDPAEFPTRERLRDAAGWFARQLDRDLPTAGRVADVGCGTGRLAALLSLRGRQVTGVDFSSAALARAQDLKRHLGLEGVSFVRGDLFRLPLRSQRFDVVLSLGVLHHTADPRIGFARLVRLLRPGGLVLIGLYNRFGRSWLRLRRWLSADPDLSANPRRLRRRLVGQIPGAAQERDEQKLRSWYHDQFLHPHELTISLGELGRWFAENGVAPLGCFPDPRWLARRRAPRPWHREKAWAGWRLGGIRAQLVQLRWAWTLAGAGGYFVQAGRLADDPARPADRQGARGNSRRALDEEGGR